MSHKKAGGTASNLKDSKPKYLGVKVFGNQYVKDGGIIIRQIGNKFRPGEGVKEGRDRTIFSIMDGFVKFTEKQITNFDGRKKRVQFVNVVKDRIATHPEKKASK
jgi:large subunit ribosomal protein L27